MKTNKEDRRAYLEQLILLLEKNTQYWKIKMARDIESDLDTQSAEIERLKTENAKLREALEFYADPKAWQSMELEDRNDDYESINPKRPKLVTGGKRARAALASLKEN